MNDPEITLNLWFVHDELGLIYALRVRPYVGTGTEHEKLAVLQGFANFDYLIAQQFSIPERFHVEIEENGKRRRSPVAPKELLNGLDSPITLFEDAIKAIEVDLPPYGLAIPEAPLFCTTALLRADESGRLYSGRRLLTLSRGDESLEVVEPTWALILIFMEKQGWSPSVSVESLLVDTDEMNDEDALALSAAGGEILTRVLGDPMSFHSAIRFDLQRFAEIMDLAAGGAFRILR